MTKRKIAIISSAGAGIAIVSYFAFTTVPALAAAIPAILTFAACPAMCAAMGGAMWLQKRRANKKNSLKMAEGEMIAPKSMALNKDDVVDSQIIPVNEQSHPQNKQPADFKN